MAEARVQLEIEAPADKVWAAVKDFGGLHLYFPLARNTRVEGEGVGAVRTFDLADGSGSIVETLSALDEAARRLQYSIQSSPLPIENYVGTIAVENLGGGRCRVDWSSTFEPNGMVETEVQEIVKGAYTDGIRGLEKLCKD